MVRLHGRRLHGVHRRGLRQWRLLYMLGLVLGLWGSLWWRDVHAVGLRLRLGLRLRRHLLLFSWTLLKCSGCNLSCKVLLSFKVFSFFLFSSFILFTFIKICQYIFTSIWICNGYNLPGPLLILLRWYLLCRLLHSIMLYYGIMWCHGWASRHGWLNLYVISCLNLSWSLCHL